MTNSVSKSLFFDDIKFFKYTKKDLNNQKTSTFSTHLATDSFAKASYSAARWLLIPWRKNLLVGAYLIEPLPGKDKNHDLWGLGKRVTVFFLFFMMLPFGMLSLFLALPFHLCEHRGRPRLSFIHNEEARFTPNYSNRLTVRTHNLGFVPESMSVATDLRDVTTRAREVAKWIEEDPHLPEVICFQEAFHRDANEILCNALRKRYPYIVHNIAPHLFDLNNGAVIASQHPIEEITFRPFHNMVGPERWTNRGLIKTRIVKNKEIIDIYAAHLQAFPGKERACIRRDQMQQVVEAMQRDQRNAPSSTALLLGDINASKITERGEENEEDNSLFELMDTHFTDVFLNDHNALGQRTQGAARFTHLDIPDDVSPLEEPTGSWYSGPSDTKKGILMKIKALYERIVYKAPRKKILKPVPRSHHWGTREWSSAQYLCSSRYDFILRYKNALWDNRYAETDRAEIRRVKVAKETQSAPTDHAPVDGSIVIM